MDVEWEKGRVEGHKQFNTFICYQRQVEHHIYSYTVPSHPHNEYNVKKN